MSVRRLELDYIAPPHRPVWPGALLLVLSFALAAELVARYRDVEAELARLEIAAGLVGSEGRPARSIPKERLDEEARNAEAVVRQLTLPWASVIETVEQAASKDVALLQLQPDAQQRLLRLGAEARSQEAMLEYLRRLGAAKFFADVHVVSHQVQLDEPQRPVQFVVQAAFREAR